MTIFFANEQQYAVIYIERVPFPSVIHETSFPDESALMVRANFGISIEQWCVWNHELWTKFICNWTLLWLVRVNWQLSELRLKRHLKRTVSHWSSVSSGGSVTQVEGDSLIHEIDSSLTSSGFHDLDIQLQSSIEVMEGNCSSVSSKDS